MAEEKRMRLWSRPTDDTDTFPAVRDDDLEPDVEPDEVIDEPDAAVDPGLGAADDARRADAADNADEADADEADADEADADEADADEADAAPDAAPHLETGSPEWLAAQWSAVL